MIYAICVILGVLASFPIRRVYSFFGKMLEDLKVIKSLSTEDSDRIKQILSKEA